MKLLFTIKKLAGAVGGAERVLCMVCSELAARGHDVTIVTFDLPEEKPFYHLDERVRLINLAVGDSSSQASVWQTLKRIYALRKLALTEQPDLAIGFMHSMFVPLAFALAGTSIPMLGSEHIVPEHYRKRPLQYALLVVASTFLSRITVLSEAIRIRYPSIVRKRMVVMPNPVEPAESLAEPIRQAGKCTLLCVGRLDEQKDHSTLLQAFAQIAPEFPDWSLRIIGEGALRFDLEQQVQSLGLNEKVEMPGVTAEIGKEYRTAEAFVISSRYEAFGLVTAEAMSYGLPVVGFADCPGTNELIENGKTGLLVEPESDRIKSLALALTRILEDPELRYQFGVNGKRTIADQFSLKHVGDLWEHLLDSVVYLKSRER